MAKWQNRFDRLLRAMASGEPHKNPKQRLTEKADESPARKPRSSDR